MCCQREEPAVAGRRRPYVCSYLLYHCADDYSEVRVGAVASDLTVSRSLGSLVKLSLFCLRLCAFLAVCKS